MKETHRILVVTCAATWLLGLGACTHLSVNDCAEVGGRVLGEDVTRIRSSHWRMKLTDTSAAASRFAPYAAMAALAYAEDEDCGNKPKIREVDRQELEKILNKSVNRLNNQEWRAVPDIENAGACEDSRGLFYRVWKRETDDSVDVVIAFRGTWGFKDWYYGNLHWITRFVTADQYDNARIYTSNVIAYFDKGAGKPASGKQVRFFATGHSLGGGLAQHALYSFPERIVQVIAFDPSSVTGFVELEPACQVAACACEPSLKSEARIYRVYDSYEILANLRIFHKLFFAPTRHVQEVRFKAHNSHSMLALALYLDRESDKYQDVEGGLPWYSAIGTTNAGMSCTEALEQAHANSCEVVPSEGSIRSRCPK